MYSDYPESELSFKGQASHIPVDRIKLEATLLPTPDVPLSQPHISGNPQTYILPDFHVNSIIFGIWRAIPTIEGSRL